MAKKRIIFICVENACRSQMAEGFARAIAGDGFEIYSAGSEPSGIVNSGAIGVMKQKGIDISNQFSKSIKDIPDVEYDYVINMGCDDECSLTCAKHRSDWQIPDPKGGPIEFFRQIRNIIESQIGEFFNGIESGESQ